MSAIKNIRLKIKPYSKIIENFSYLSLLQIFNLVLPLISYPYLIRVLGANIYGMIIYSQAIISYLVVIVNFGFNITATKEISINKNSTTKINEIVSSIYIIKGILFLIALFILFIFLEINNQTHTNKILFYLTFWMCLYEFIFPLWYFQGIEKMKYITFLTLISRLTFLGLIFLLIHSPTDYLWVPTINGIGAIISSILAINILNKEGLKLKWQTVPTLISYVKSSYIMALSYSTNIFKTSFNIILVKHLFSLKEVAYFDLAMKIITLGTTFLDLISQAVFPKMSRTKDILFLKKILTLSFFVSIVMMLFIQYFAPILVQILGGGNMNEASKITRLMALNLPVYIIGALLGRNCLLIFGYDQFVLKSMIYSGVFYLFTIIVYFLTFPSPELTGFIYAYLFSFLFETIYRYKVCDKENLLKA